MSIYKGFSFLNYEYNKSFILTDIDLVNRDLYNHIFTKVRDRVKMPRFGTTIPDMLFEPLTEDLLFDIDSQLRTVFNYDPRVELLDLNIYPFYDTQEVYASANLRYIELDFTGKLDVKLEFEG